MSLVRPIIIDDRLHVLSTSTQYEYSYVKEFEIVLTGVLASRKHDRVRGNFHVLNSGYVIVI